ncbi:MAG TPA: FtsK/SpoIIIE domain-containing protein [Dermatophilaceae bacterium]|nr:FtsK/SpoIIIE domain-containing protein [Dermatophilaceae bacterium]
MPPAPATLPAPVSLAPRAPDVPLRLGVLAPGVGGVVEVDLVIRPGATIADLLVVLPSWLVAGPTPLDAARPLPATARLGDPPLLQGAVLDCRAGAARLVGGTSPGTLLALHVTAGPDAGLVHGLEAGRHTVGRGAECRLRLSDPALSRVHAIVTVSGDQVVISDSLSTNGTHVNGRSVVEPRLLAPGDIVAIGATTLQVRSPRVVPAAVRPDGRGHLVVMRGGAGGDLPAPVEVRFPEPPTSGERARLSWATALAPLAISIVMAAVLRSPTMLLFGLMSPVVVGAQWLADLRRGRVTTRRRQREYAAQFAEAQDALALAVRREQEMRCAAYPDLAATTELASRRLAGLWVGSGDRLEVRVGTGSLPAATVVQGAAPVRVSDVPVVIDCTDGVGLCGSPAEVEALARAVVGRLVTEWAPGEVAVIAHPSVDEEAWAWLGRLPHWLGPWPEADSAATRSAMVTAMGGGRRLVVVTREDPGLLPEDPASEVWLAERPAAVPARLAQLVDCAGEVRELDVVGFAPDGAPLAWAERLAHALHPLRDDGRGAGAAMPRVVSLLDLLALPCDELGEPDLVAAWSDCERSTRIVLGANAGGVVELDLDRDGPHGLVGGTTGAGKSELLVSLVAALAAGNRPDELALVLVDYKGGAAFAGCRALPHVVGVVTDLDARLTERALDSLSAELRRRERILADAGVPDLAAYHRVRRDVDPRLGRLVIVVDELRALVEELPDFVSGLVRIASLGRSLGVHLVVATQRPSGVVTADLRANLGLRIALRMRDATDSHDIVECRDAAAIGEDTPGRALVSSPARPLTPVQTARATAPRPRAGAPVRVASIGGLPIDDQKPGGPTDLELLAHAATRAVAELGIEAPASPWLPPLPVRLTTAELADPRAMGLRDEPAAQRQTWWSWDPWTEPGLGIVGGPRSGRSTTLHTIVSQLSLAHSPDALHVYAVHAGSLADLAELPQVGAVVDVEDRSRLSRMLDLLAGQTDPAPGVLRLLVVDDWERCLERLDQARAAGLAASLGSLVQAGGEGRAVLLAGGRGLVSGQVARAIGRRIVLVPVDPVDLTLAGLSARQAPTPTGPGRGIDPADGLELQVASVVGEPTPARRAAYSGVLGSRLRERYAALPPEVLPEPVPLLPSVVPLELVLSSARGPGSRWSSELPLGWDGSEVVGLRLLPGERAVAVLGGRGSGRTTALRTLAAVLATAGRPVVAVGFMPDPELPTGDVLSVAIEDRDALVALRRRHADLAVLVDDGARADPAMEAVLGEILRCVDEDAGLLVVSGQPREVLEGRRGVLSVVAGHGVGLLLGPMQPGEERALGFREALHTDDLPGRGWLVRRGRRRAVQVGVSMDGA